MKKFKENKALFFERFNKIDTGRGDSQGVYDFFWGL